MHARVYKIQSGKLEQWKSWCEKLNTSLRDEAKSTIKEEGGTFESVLVFSLGDDWYTVGISDAVKSGNMDRAINQEHQRQKKECLESGVSVEVFYSL